MSIKRKLKSAHGKAADLFLTACILATFSVQEAVAQTTGGTGATLDLTQDPTGGKTLDGLISGGGKTLFGQIMYWIFQVLAPFVGGLLVFRAFMKVRKEQEHERKGWWVDLLVGFILVGFTVFVFRLRNTIMAW